MDARQEAGEPRLGCGMLSQPAMVGQPQRPGRELQYRRVAQASRPLLPLLLLLLLLLFLLRCCCCCHHHLHIHVG